MIINIVGKNTVALVYFVKTSSHVDGYKNIYSEQETMHLLLLQ